MRALKKILGEGKKELKDFEARTSNDETWAAVVVPL